MREYIVIYERAKTEAGEPMLLIFLAWGWLATPSKKLKPSSAKE